MQNISPTRRFTNPGNTDGIPRVRTRKAIPVRATPLPGTKTMQTPRDGNLLELIRRPMERTEKPSRTAQVMGWLAIGCVASLWLLLWFVSRGEGIDIRNSHDGLFTGLIILFLGGAHVCAIFSQVLSNGRNMMGSIALVALYIGSILLAILDHLLR